VDLDSHPTLRALMAWIDTQLPLIISKTVNLSVTKKMRDRKLDVHK